MGKFAGAMALGVALCLSGYGQGPNIFGADDRQPVTSTAYPWRTIGWLTGGCTATLVAKNLVITAAHSVFDDEKNLKALDFYPNLVNSNSVVKSAAVRTWWGTKTPENERGSDWAIILLADNLGDTYGWMGTTSDKYDRVTLVGYSGDYNNGMTATTHIGCSIRERLPSIWLHDCDATRGSSGGPLFTMVNDKPLIIGVEAAEYRNGGEVSLKLEKYTRENANIAVPTSAFIATLRKVIDEYAK